MEVPRVWEVCKPHEDVLEGKAEAEEFVVNLGAVWERVELKRTEIRVPKRYLDPVAFAKRTWLTEAMATIIASVMMRISKGVGQSTYVLHVSMGGGKSHTLLLLYYIVKLWNTIGSIIIEKLEELRKALEGIRPKELLSKLTEIPRPPEDVRVVVLDCSRIRPVLGYKFPDGTTVRTLWGFLLKELDMYDPKLDIWEHVPSVADLRKVLNKPTLILIDELTSYAENLVGDRPKFEKLKVFMQFLTIAVSEVSKAVLLIAVPAGVYEETWKELRSLIGRYASFEVLAKPEEHNKIRRAALFEEYRDVEIISKRVARLMAKELSKYRETYRGLPDPDSLEKDIEDTYPFHPFVHSTLAKLRSSPAFQEVRDELRFLASLVYSFYKQKPEDGYLISIAHADIRDPYVKGGTIAKVQLPWIASLDEDILRLKNAFIKHEARLKIAFRILSTIVLNSLAAPRDEELGVTLDEIVYAIITPQIPAQLVEETLRDIMKKARLHFLTISKAERYVYGIPSPIKIIEELVREIERKRCGEWWEVIKDILSKEIDGAYEYYEKQYRKPKLFTDVKRIILWPHSSEEIPDTKVPTLVFVDYVLPLDEVISKEVFEELGKSMKLETKVRAVKRPEEVIEVVKDFFENYGKSLRNFRNTVFFLVASRDIVKKVVDLTKEVMALEKIARDHSKQEEIRLKYGESILNDLLGRYHHSLSSLSSEIIQCYRYLVYPSAQGLSVLQLGYEEVCEPSKIICTIQEKLDSERKILYDKVEPEVLLERYWILEDLKLKVSKFIDNFYRTPSLELPVNEGIILQSIVTAIQKGKLALIRDDKVYIKASLPKIEKEDILSREIELVTIKISAITTSKEQLSVTIYVNEEIYFTPTSIEKLRGTKYRVRVDIPIGYRFLKWSDGVEELERVISWDYNTTFTVIFEKIVEEIVTIFIDSINEITSEKIEVQLKMDSEFINIPGPISKPKGYTAKVEILEPQGYQFVEWDDGISSKVRQIRWDKPTMLVAKFRPRPEEEVWERVEIKRSLRDVPKLISSYWTHLVRFVRVRIVVNVDNFITTTMIMRTLFTNMKEGSLKFYLTNGRGGLRELEVSGEGEIDALGKLRNIALSLRKFLKTCDVTLEPLIEQPLMLKEILNETAIEALSKHEGEISITLEVKRL